MSFCLYNKKNNTQRLEYILHLFGISSSLQLSGYPLLLLHEVHSLRESEHSWHSSGKNNIYSLAALVRKILFCHSKIKFISSRHRVISSTCKLESNSAVNVIVMNRFANISALCYDGIHEVWNSNQQHPSHIPCGNNITNKRANVCGEKKKYIKTFRGVYL